MKTLAEQLLENPIATPLRPGKHLVGKRFRVDLGKLGEQDVTVAAVSREPMGPDGYETLVTVTRSNGKTSTALWYVFKQSVIAELP